MPTFATSLARAKVDKLMQPALIRVIDNIRKQLDQTDWQGDYEEKFLWPEGTTPEQQQEYVALQKLLHGVPPEEHDRVAALMSELPQPSPLYTLRLTKTNHDDQAVDIWALCYQVCAVNAPLPAAGIAESKEAAADASTPIEADESLFDELGEVDWQLLDDKTKALVEGIFKNLPN